MLTDHVGAVFFPDQMIFRWIGRIAFPLFVFLIVEGFFHTGNIRKYELRLLIFALISEIPFDLVFSGKILEFSYQNVFFTLFLGLVMLDVMRRVRSRFLLSAALAGELAVLILFMAAAWFLDTDYSAGGILLIYVFYKFRGKFLWMTAALFLISLLCFGTAECPAVCAMLPVSLYNGKRGFGKKSESGQKRTGATAVQYLFYLFYPVHLLILYGISLWRG